MKARLPVPVLLMVFGLSLAVSWPATAADSYDIDAVHSTVLFQAKRMDVVNVYGRFGMISGSLTVDDAAPANSSIEIEIKLDSVDTNNARRDAHLKGPDFFNAKEFPVMTYKSTVIKKTGDHEFEVRGDLSLLGVTKPVTAKVRQTGAGKDPRTSKPLIGFETSFTLNRSEFGMMYGAGMISDEVGVILAIHGVGR